MKKLTVYWLKEHSKLLIFGFFMLGAIGALIFLANSIEQDQLRLVEATVYETTTIKALAQNELKELKRTQSLAIQFNVTPLIVKLVEHYAAQEMTTIEENEWSFIHTPDYLSYLMLSLIWVESKGNPSAVGDSGKARGLTQIWTTTARMYRKDVTQEQLLHPETNIAISFQHFHELLINYHGNFALVLYAWNRGQNKVDTLMRIGLVEVENGYAAKVYMAALTDNHLRLGK